MDFIYKDDNLAVLIKPPGVSSQADKSGNPSVVELLQDYFSSVNEKNDIYVVHRLDKNVGGLMVYARTHIAASSLSGQIRNGTFKKSYLCLVHGCPENDSGVFEDLLYRDKSKNKTYVVKRIRKSVKKAVLSYSVLNSFDSPFGHLSFVRVNLITGRSHQIRVQFASRKMPLLGDGKYGAADNFGSLALWSSHLSFVHPVTGEEMVFDCIINADDFLNKTYPISHL